MNEINIDSCCRLCTLYTPLNRTGNRNRSNMFRLDFSHFVSCCSLACFLVLFFFNDVVEHLMIMIFNSIAFAILLNTIYSILWVFSVHSVGIFFCIKFKLRVIVVVVTTLSPYRRRCSARFLRLLYRKSFICFPINLQTHTFLPT